MVRLQSPFTPTNEAATRVDSHRNKWRSSSGRAGNASFATPVKTSPFESVLVLCTLPLGEPALLTSPVKPIRGGVGILPAQPMHPFHVPRPKTHRHAGPAKRRELMYTFLPSQDPAEENADQDPDQATAVAMV